jgi:hypothetical protein
MDNRYFGVTWKDLRRIEFKLVETYDVLVPNLFSREKGLAGKKWLCAFLTRIPSLSVRTHAVRIEESNVYELEMTKIKHNPKTLLILTKQRFCYSTQESKVIRNK